MKGVERIAIEGEPITYGWHGWHVECTWPGLGRQGPESIIKVMHKRINGGTVVAPRRVSLQSNTGTSSLIGDMNRYVKSMDFDDPDPGVNPSQVHLFVQAVIADLILLFQQTGNSTTINWDRANRDRSQSWLLKGLWPASGSTAIAAGGGSGKSFFAQAIAMSLATGHNLLQRMPIKDVPQRRVLYLDFESDMDTFVDRAHSLMVGYGGLDFDVVQQNLRYFPLMGHRLQDVVPKIRTEIEQHGMEAVVVDSMSASVGEGLIDDAIVNAYWDAIAQLGVPSLIVVHKSAENVAKRKARIFGSIMSENRLRMAWNMERTNDGSSVLLKCFKDNNTGMYGREWAFDHEIESDEDTYHVVRSAFMAVDPETIRSLFTDDGSPQSDTWHDKIFGVLAGGPMNVREIRQTLGSGSEDTIRKTLNRGDGVFARRTDGRWELA